MHTYEVNIIVHIVLTSLRTLAVTAIAALVRAILNSIKVGDPFKICTIELEPMQAHTVQC